MTNEEFIKQSSDIVRTLLIISDIKRDVNQYIRIVNAQAEMDCDTLYDICQKIRDDIGDFQVQLKSLKKEI